MEGVIGGDIRGLFQGRGRKSKGIVQARVKKRIATVKGDGML
jgi:hypothetical protein